MPAVVSSLVVAGLSSAGVFAAGSASAIVVGAAIDLGLTFGIGKVIQYLNKEDEDNFGAATDEGFTSTTERNVSQNVPYQRIILGEVTTGGIYCFHASSKIGSVVPDDAKGGSYLVSSFLLANHLCESIERIKLGDQETFPDSGGFSLNPQFILDNKQFIAQSVRLGTDDQQLDPIIQRNFPEVPATFRQVGHCVATLEYYYGADSDEHDQVYGNNIELKPEFRIRGAKVYDPRDPFQDPFQPNTWQWTRNAALNMVGLLTKRDFGRRISYNDFDMGALREAADVCDTAFTDRYGNKHPNYTIDGVIETNENQLDVIETMLLAMFGKMTWQYNKYFIFAGQQEAPIATIDESELLDSIEYNVGLPSNEIINSIKGRFIGTEAEIAIAETPTIQSDSAVLADGQVNEKTVNFRFTEGSARTQRLMKFTLDRARLQKRLIIKINKRALTFLSGDIIRIQSPSMRYLESEYEIESIRANNDFNTFTIELAEYGENLFSWNPQTDEKPFTIENLPL